MKICKEQWNRLCMDSRTFSQRFWLLFVPVCCLCFTILFCSPIQIFLNNVSEFWFPLSMFWWLCLLVFLFGLLLCMLPCLIIKGKLLDLYVCFLFSAALILYLQGNFMNISYGELNGQAVDWSRYGRYALINTFIITVLFLLPVFIRYLHRTFWLHMIRFLSVLIIAMQTAGLVALYLPYRKTAQNTAFGMSWDGVSGYSPDRNLVLIILDSFDEPYFSEFLSAHPEEAKMLDGFTYYRNTAGISSSTIYSMVPMLTGIVCTWEEGTFDSYLQSAWEKEQFFHRLFENRYDIRALTASSSQYGYLGKNGIPFFQNRIPADKHPASYKEFLGLLYSLALYTYMPHILKPGFWIVPDDFSYLMRSSFYQEDDTDSFLRFQQDPIQPNSPSPAFRLYHFKSMHPPLTLGTDAQRQSSSVTTALESEEGSFKIVHLLLDQMKQAGVYDTASIIIAADHASTDHVPGYLDSVVYCPLLLYKPLHAEGDMVISDAPASLFDVRATFLKDASLPYSDQGTPLSELSETTVRTRYFYRHLGVHKTLYEFSIGSEDANQIENYTQTGVVYYSPTNP